MPQDAVGPVSVIVDKMEKIPLEKVAASLAACTAVMEMHRVVFSAS